MKHNTFLVKPASSLCNLRCRYCFYDDVSNSRACKNMGLLSHEMAGELVEKALQPQRKAAASIFCFSGDRLLPGWISSGSFWKRSVPCSAISLCSTASRPMAFVWMKSGLPFSSQLFLVGLSLGRTQENHDLYRLDGSWQAHGIK